MAITEVNLGSQAVPCRSQGRLASNIPVLFFDVDDCLYPQSARVREASSDLINRYFENHLGLSKEDTIRLREEYYKNFGLIVEGLVYNHKIDPLQYNSMVDDSIALDSLIKPDPKLRQLLQDIDKSKVRLWLFTNAYVTHARRVVRLLGVDDFFEGVTYCDYARVPLVCKPQAKMFEEAMRAAGVESNTDCYFVDDSFTNCRGAHEFGWTAVHLVEEGLPTPPSQASQHQIQSLEELRTLFPHFFKGNNEFLSTSHL
ncbi:pyrimidine 5'-nucleotidase [Annulohypoxylon maeteangense]|uniref:pyrimidine 5'-nucleotidase n=1 Tax=Annulohypoxylon maeteangense TaxID=1927788 RepID=UPI002007A355|nr:pyrimidine 5'-nucleotidase [Annulohypoxylon maeteangense]KAI0884180.1 pyrimidine 5'-nucleotidase [Annulohypoxylon maeteangense]